MGVLGLTLYHTSKRSVSEERKTYTHRDYSGHLPAMNDLMDAIGNDAFANHRSFFRPYCTRQLYKQIYQRDEYSNNDFQPQSRWEIVYCKPNTNWIG